MNSEPQNENFSFQNFLSQFTGGSNLDGTLSATSSFNQKSMSKPKSNNMINYILIAIGLYIAYMLFTSSKSSKKSDKSEFF